MNQSCKKVVTSNKAPIFSGVPISQAIQVGNALYLSGMIGIDANSKQLVSGEIRGQTRCALVNIGHVLEAAQASYKDVVKVTVFLSDMAHFSTVNEIYRDFFEEPYPARSAFQVAKLPLDALVEIEVVAVIGTTASNL